MKHDDIRELEAVAYAIPLLWTYLLAAFGLSKATPSPWTASIFITLGAALAAKDMLLVSRASSVRS